MQKVGNAGLAAACSGMLGVVNHAMIMKLVSFVVAIALMAGAGYYIHEKLDPTEQQLASLRDMPLVGVAISDHSDVQNLLRTAIREDEQNPIASGPSRVLQIISDVRRDDIAPAIRGADDKSVIAAMAARAELVGYLQKADPQACREFSMGGITHPEKLDPEGQRRFHDLLVAMEVAYRNGRNAKPQPIPLRQEVGVLLQQAGFTKPDFDKLNNFAMLSNDVSCEMELKIDLVVPRLPPDKQGPFSRFIVAQ
jgi:hypothetical protein